MALANQYSQSYIDNLDINHIPEDFIAYFNRVTDERRKAIVESRPELAVLLNRSEEPKDNSVINDNGYCGADVVHLIKNGGLERLVALSKDKEKTTCPAHHVSFEQFNYEFHYEKKKNNIPILGKYGVNLYVCTTCNRLFINADDASFINKRLVEVGISCHISSLSESMEYLHSIAAPVEIEDTNYIYIQEDWIEGREKCVIHGCLLDEIKAVKRYKDRAYSFRAYYCDECKRIILRNSMARDVEYELGVRGITQLQFKKQVKEIPPHKIVKAKIIKPKYIIDNGSVELFDGTESKVRNLTDVGTLIYLEHEDTLAISDSVYCDFDGHESEQKLIVLDIKEKKGNETNKYIMLGGFCPDCQKYYVSIADYQCAYSIGHLDVQVNFVVDDDGYLITSGEVYDLESDHLKGVETEITNREKAIHSAPDYVDPYETHKGAYDDSHTGLQYAKMLSERKYGEELEILGSYRDKPYVYRVDAKSADRTMTIYLGSQEVIIDGKKYVESYVDTFWRNVVNVRTLQFKLNGIEYKVKLNRRFEIQKATLFGFLDQLSEADISFQHGITDPFLVRVLKLRQKQHGLINIISTIQENQNTIIDESYNTSIIVQGCAGSGKTMVLLHRIASLAYNAAGFDRSKTLIITPNEGFNLHISDVVNDLQIGYIRRVSVEGYYVDLLKLYSSRLHGDRVIRQEESTDQSFVDYVYSDSFKESFLQACDNQIQKLLVEYDTVRNLANGMKLLIREPKPDSAYEMRINAIKILSDVRRTAEKRTETVLRIKDQLNQQILRKEALNDRISSFDEMIYRETKASLTRVYQVFLGLVKQQNERHEQIQNQIKSIEEKKEELQKRFFAIQRTQKVENFDREIFKLSEDDKKELQLLQEYEEYTRKDVSAFDVFATIQWYSAIQYHSPLIGNEIKLLNRLLESHEEDKRERIEIQNEISAFEERVRNSLSDQLDENTIANIVQHEDNLNLYDDITMFGNAFASAANGYIEEHPDFKVPVGDYRYTLYTMLLFCRVYYRRTPGNARFICVDEGQDITLNEYRLIYEMNDAPIMNIYGDNMQNLKPGRGVSDWTEVQNLFESKIYTLNENYRNTNQITDFCNSTFDMQVKRTGVDGPKVVEISRRELEEKLSKLKVNDERIAILISRTYAKKDFIKIDTVSPVNAERIGEEIGNGKIALKYVDEVKGIEFDRVYVVTNNMSRNEKYIAFTRALTKLVPVIIQEESGIA